MKPALPLLLIWLATPVLAQDRFSQTAFTTWLHSSSARQTQLQAFQTFLTDNQVADILPAYQLWRTATSSANCQADAFTVPDRQYWPNIVTTLRFIRDEIEPAIGPVEAVSGYRDEALNRCSGGARHSAHRTYFALDLIPADPSVTRAVLIRMLCTVHATKGQDDNIGLGFYAATRFHIDSMRYRRWGPDGTGKTSPCAS